MSQQNFISKEARIKELITKALKGEARYLNGKKIVFCKRVSDLYKYEDVAIKIQNFDEITFRILYSNLSSSEYQALNAIVDELCSGMKIRKINFSGSDYSASDFATMDIIF